MISVTAKSRYAVVGMAELARHSGKPVPIATVAERRGIPVQFLEQLFSTLRRAGILVRQRGAKGGYTLARAHDTLTVLYAGPSAGGEHRSRGSPGPRRRGRPGGQGGRRDLGGGGGGSAQHLPRDH